MIACVPLRGEIEVNGYVWADQGTGHGFLIDPGAQGRELTQWIRRRGLVIEKILLTHGHFDHIGGIEAIRSEMDIPVYIHEAGEAFLNDPRLNLSCYCSAEIRVEGACLFREGQVFSLQGGAGGSLRVIHTPGHTPDSCVFYDEKQGIAFTGDTIFKGSRGNDRFPGGDGEELLRSIREKVLTLPEETILYSGHSEPTTVRDEKRYYF